VPEVKKQIISLFFDILFSLMGCRFEKSFSRKPYFPVKQENTPASQENINYYRAYNHWINIVDRNRRE
jgi:hypothetical protein